MDSAPDLVYALGIALLCLHVTHFLIREINECRRNRNPVLDVTPDVPQPTEPFASTADEVDILHGGPGGADVPDVAA